MGTAVLIPTFEWTHFRRANPDAMPTAGPVSATLPGMTPKPGFIIDQVFCDSCRRVHDLFVTEHPPRRCEVEFTCPGSASAVRMTIDVASVIPVLRKPHRTIVAIVLPTG